MFLVAGSQVDFRAWSPRDRDNADMSLVLLEVFNFKFYRSVYTFETRHN